MKRGINWISDLLTEEGEEGIRFLTHQELYRKLHQTSNGTALQKPAALTAKGMEEKNTMHARRMGRRGGPIRRLQTD